jgi:hypothetical protein
MEFALVKSGLFSGDLVRYSFTTGNPSLMVTPPPPVRSATGYGRKLPTRYKVRTIDQRWRRVYCCCFSNVGTCYIVQNGENVIVDITT